MKTTQKSIKGMTSASKKTREKRALRRFEMVPGRVFRTADLAAATKNPSRLAKQLVSEGILERLAGGLYGVPKDSKFGRLTPRSDDIIATFLKGAPYLLTGPEFWNATGLGSTAVFPVQIIYNRARSAKLDLGGRRFWFVRKEFPPEPTPEWYAIDLIEHRDMMGVELKTLRAGLRSAVEAGRLSAPRLQRMAAEWATKRVAAFVEESLRKNSSR